MSGCPSKDAQARLSPITRRAFFPANMDLLLIPADEAPGSLPTTQHPSGGRYPMAHWTYREL